MEQKEVFLHATQEDAEQILRLYRSLVGTECCTWTEDYPTEREVSYDLSRNALFCLKNQETGNLMGVISSDEDANVEVMDCWSEALKPSRELSRVAVVPEYQNQGVAGRLMTYAMEELKKQGNKGVHLLVSKTNEKALRAYGKLDFANVGECQLYGCDFWCYERKL